MSAARIVVLDRDGVINVDVPGKYVCSPEDWIPIEGSLAAMARLTQAGFDIYVVSNQSGIGRGLFTVDALQAMHRKFLDALSAHGGQLAGWFYCPHTPADGCACRKPRTGLLDQVRDAAGRSLHRVPFIGDKTTDLQAARSCRMRGMLVGTGHGREALLCEPASVSEYFDDLPAAVSALIDGAVGEPEEGVGER